MAFEQARSQSFVRSDSRYKNIDRLLRMRQQCIHVILFRRKVMLYFRSRFWLILALALASDLFTIHTASAAQLTLSWTDASDNEDGFAIERKTGTSGTFARVASVGSNISTYTDASLASSTTYCYRVNAFNTAGNSPYTNEICGTTLAASFTLTLNRSGNGTVTSSPAGINCGSDCT